MDTYATLANFYDIENAGFVEDLSVYFQLASQQGDPILDVGCGTGRVSFALARQGYRVVGIDNSPAMLERARSKLARQSFEPEQVRLEEADVTRLALKEQFRLAIFAYNGFMHLTERGDQLNALKAIRQHLAEDGALVLDLPNPIEVYASVEDGRLVVERTFEDADSGETILQQSSVSLDRVSQTMRVTWLYDRIRADGSVSRTLVPVDLRYTFLAELALLLERTGMSLRDTYGDYDFTSYQESSPRMLVVAAAGAA